MEMLTAYMMKKKNKKNAKPYGQGPVESTDKMPLVDYDPKKEELEEKARKLEAKEYENPDRSDFYSHGFAEGGMVTDYSEVPLKESPEEILHKMKIKKMQEKADQEAGIVNDEIKFMQPSKMAKGGKVKPNRVLMAIKARKMKALESLGDMEDLAGGDEDLMQNNSISSMESIDPKDKAKSKVKAIMARIASMKR